jgi:dynein heavy chain, axonemal
LYRLTDHISELTEKLSKTKVKDIDSLGVVMEKLEEIRSFQAVIDISFGPVTEMYVLLDNNLPGGITDKD